MVKTVEKRDWFFDLPDGVWRRINSEALIPIYGKQSGRKKSKRGRPPLEERKIMAFVLFVIAYQITWEELSFQGNVSKSTARRYFHKWLFDGVFDKLGKMRWQERIINGFDCAILNQLEIRLAPYIDDMINNPYWKNKLSKSTQEYQAAF